jgi:DNA polymerase III epsilon subunit-like protein
LKKWDIKWVDYIYPDTIDVRSLSINSLLKERDTMKDFKLMTVAEKLGVNINGEAHTALFDIEVTRDIYYNI